MVVLLAFLQLDLVQAQMEGWRMIDRFHGFRFEITGKVQNEGFRRAVQEKADSLGCFGWVQNTEKGTLVGEARCSKVKGPLLQEWLREGPTLARVDHVDFKDYESTKIVLHFSHFKVLPDSRITCFRDAPHQCPDFVVAVPPTLEEGKTTTEGKGEATTSSPMSNIASSMGDSSDNSSAIIDEIEGRGSMRRRESSSSASAATKTTDGRHSEL